MKTERRHELKHNELADQLAKWTESVAPYSRIILGVVILVIVAIFAGAFMAKKSAQKNAEGWQQYFDAYNKFDAEGLSDNAKKYSGTTAGQWSSLMAGEMLLAQGAEQLFSDKTAARSKLQEAVDRYQSVLINTSEPIIRERALFGLARAFESRGELPKALEQYSELLKSFPNGMFTDVARGRVKDLESDSTKKFYDWFAKYEPPRRTKGLTGKPGERPSEFMDDLPDGPDISLPSVIGDKLQPEKEKLPLPEKDAPADGDAKPDDAKPADETPGDEKPADAKPADETPGDEKPAAEPEDSAAPDESAAKDDAKPASDSAASPAKK